MTTHKRVGVALSGGVARGAAHVGVLLALERSGIPIDVVSGTSAGALVGALYCGGITPARMIEYMARFGWRHIARPVLPLQGFVSFKRLERWLTDTIGVKTFADLRRPFVAMATDVDSGASVTLCSGAVAPAVHASCAVPGFVVPVQWNGRRLCDGGVTCNLPVAQARALGADFVIGVDVCQPYVRRWWGALGVGIGALENLVRHAGGGLATADCLIAPALAGQSFLNFHKARAFIALGERAAEEKLPAIRAALA